MKRERVGLGMIGCGWIADVMYLPHTNRDVLGCRVDLVATSDVVSEKAERAKDRWGAVRAYADYRELLADPAVEAVVIATNIASHAEIALAAAQAGKHILLQKPIAERLEDAEATIQACRESGVYLQVEPAHMLNPLCVQAREIVASGALGKVCLVQGKSVHRGAEDRAWLFQRAGGGSVMLDLGVHALTWLVSIAGPAKRVTAFQETSLPIRNLEGTESRIDIDDNVTVMLDFGDGCLGSMITNYITVADQSPSFDVFGGEGTLHISGPLGPLQVFSRKAEYLGRNGWLSPTVDSVHMHRQTPAPTPQDNRGTQPYSSMGHFIASLADDRQPTPSGEIARHVLEIMVRGAEAARTGRTQTLETTFTLG